ncbi:putative DNA polymerase III chi subunit, HolC [Planktomarina temperata RCA23]|uniref:DNA polymerase III chi subunit, HolC n=1 Tax=Planktomarina temperata RCA23 TaxID=666509 RepID=A0AAN0VIL8_9RHOB|nr:putative DNA polymerase III chi subunit, HolC [Planktomarina temperata RCA23]
MDQALRPLLSKCLANGWRVVIRGREAAEIQQLDDDLWQGPAEEFLPHGLAGAAQEADQPVLLALEGHEAPHDCLMCIGGSAVTADEVLSSKRVCILFQDDNGQHMQNARAQWKSLTEAGIAAKYWSQAQGNWALQAEKEASNA